MDSVLTTEGLGCSFEGFMAVRDLDLKVLRGSIHALFGPNGAGKTPVFNLLTKFLPPTTGRVSFNGRDITDARAWEVARMGIVRSFQISAVFPRLSVRENVRIALQQAMGRSYRFWQHVSSLARLDARVDELLDAVGLADAAETPAMELPYGRKRALEIATTLALDPELLLLDEPIAGLGQDDIRRVSDLIRSRRADRTILMVEHNLSVVVDLSETITVLIRGEILAEGSYEEIAGNGQVQEAYLGVGHD